MIQIKSDTPILADKTLKFRLKTRPMIEVS